MSRACHRSIVAMIVSVMAGCGGGGGGYSYSASTPGDTMAPAVLSTAPDSGASDVATGTTVSAVFSEPMDPATLDTITFTLEDSGGNPVAGTVAISNGDATATFTPNAPLDSAASYTATVTTQAHDAAGNALASNYVWSFTTQAASDTTAPTVSATSPADAATGVALSATVSATFSEAMDPATLTSGTFTVEDNAANPVAGTLTVTTGNTVATFTPDTALANGTTYTATVTTGAQDASGNALAADHAWSFTTVPAPTHSVFLTSTVATGNLGGLSGADQICATRAAAAGLPGTWRAWISAAVGGSAVHAKDRVSDVSGGWALPGTSAVAVASTAELSALNTTAPIDRDENGAVITPQPQRAWTGTTSGGVASGSDCAAWTSTNSSGYVYVLGSSSTITQDVASCASSARLLCLEQ